MYSDDLKINFVSLLFNINENKCFNSLTDFLKGELRILDFLEKNDENVTPSMLSEKLLVSRARITAALNTLRKKGYIDLENCEHDRRKIFVKINEKGKKYLYEKLKIADDNFEIFYNRIGEKNIYELIRLLKLSIEVMGKCDKK